MPPFLGFLVERRWEFSVGFRGNDWRDVPVNEFRAQPVCVKGAVGKQVIRGEVFDQLRHGTQVMGLPGDKAEISQVAERIGQGQNLGGDAAP